MKIDKDYLRKGQCCKSRGWNLVAWKVPAEQDTWAATWHEDPMLELDVNLWKENCSKDIPIKVHSWSNICLYLNRFYKILPARSKVLIPSPHFPYWLFPDRLKGKGIGKLGSRDIAAIENTKMHLPTAKVKRSFWPAFRFRFNMDNLTYRIGLCI